jgi:putative transport protein
MADLAVGFLRQYPEVTFFLVLGIGYLVGKLRVGSFLLGSVAGTLLAGVALGQLGVHVSPEVKQCFFLLFLFSIGFRTGPQFFRGLKRDGLQQAALAAIVATTGLIVAFIVGRALDYDVGTAAGLIAGALTESATIGTASDAIARLSLPDDVEATLVNQIPVAFAVTYLIGVLGAAAFLAQVAPRIMRINLKEECRRYERLLQGDRVTEAGARRDIEIRAYRILPGSTLAGRRVRDLENVFVDARLFVEQLRRGCEIMEPDESTRIEPGDTLAITARRELLVAHMDEAALGIQEVDDRDLLDVPAEMLDVVVTRTGIDGRTLGELAREEFARGVFLRRLTRAGTAVVALPGTQVHRGDVLTLVGPTRRVAQAVSEIGVPDRATDATDVALVAFSIVAGALIGTPAIMLGRVELGLSVSVGVLLGGLVSGWMRSRWPQFFGRIPTPTLWTFESLGLAGFVAIVGLDAGPEFLEGLRTNGSSLIAAGLIVVIVPHLVGILLGHWVFAMEPAVLLGVCAGAGTATPALAAIQEAAESSAPTLGYGVAYAVGNVLLALWGSVIVAIL